MKKVYFFFIVLFILLIYPVSVRAQGMMGQFSNSTTQNSTDSSTAADEAKGKAIFDKLQKKQTDCKSLTDDDFEY